MLTVCVLDDSKASKDPLLALVAFDTELLADFKHAFRVCLASGTMKKQ